MTLADGSGEAVMRILLKFKSSGPKPVPAPVKEATPPKVEEAKAEEEPAEDEERGDGEEEGGEEEVEES